MTLKVRKQRGSSNGLYKAVINGEMTIYQAQEHKDALLKALRGGKQLEINLSDVDEFDSAGFQVLCLLKKEADRLEKEVKLVECSPAIVEILDLFGMNDNLVTAAVETGKEPL